MVYQSLYLGLRSTVFLEDCLCPGSLGRAGRAGAQVISRWAGSVLKSA